MLRQVGCRQWLRLRHLLGTLAQVSEAGSGLARDWWGGEAPPRRHNTNNALEDEATWLRTGLAMRSLVTIPGTRFGFLVFAVSLFVLVQGMCP